MTQLYNYLKEKGPITESPFKEGIRGQLTFEERAELREISSGGSSPGRTNAPTGQLTPVYYLEGDEEAAAQRFVAENRAQLEEIDYSKRNIVSDLASREIYDLILHHLGERVREVYPTVVHEQRKDGLIWLIPRGFYEDRHNRRYHQKHSARVPPEVDLQAIYEDGPDPLDVNDVEEVGVEGQCIEVLKFYCDAEEFDCTPITLPDDTPAIEKE